MYATPNKTLAHRLRLAVKASGHKREWIEHKSGWSMSHVNGVISGRRPNPSINFVWAMACTLGVSPAWLLGWESESA